jgi:hypothetical protein
MSHGSLEATKFRKMVGAIHQSTFDPTVGVTIAPPSPRECDEIVEIINSKIARFDQNIVKLEFGLNQVEYYVFYSTAKTSISSMHHTFTETELDFFKMLLLFVLESEELNTTPLHALNITTATKINKTRIEKMLDTWIMNGYFLRQDHKIYLGPKSVMEFKEIIQSMELPHLRSCILCEEVAAWV